MYAFIGIYTLSLVVLAGEKYTPAAWSGFLSKIDFNSGTFSIYISPSNKE